ncbi:MAG: sigma 54-interacting transcriptional regulator [Proteobacteria bacterium]|nr:sigma 54-interacting transcriptional regulator [Pseudomonadota bacterium]
MEEKKILLDILGKYGHTPVIACALKFIFRNPYETLIVTDRNARIEFMDRGSEKFFGLSQGDARGTDIRELFPHSSIPITLENGIPIVGRIFEVKDKKGIGTVYPIIKEEKIIGALARLTFYSLEVVDRINSEMNRLRRKVSYFEEKQQGEYSALYTFNNILGISSLIKDTIEIAKRISLVNTDVLIVGESGTGKELFAHSIHDFTHGEKPFVKINCPAIPFELAESELFGYEKGAFSGALSSGKIGKFEVANNGTIFLDEISSLPLSVQAKLLRVLEEREIERLGSTKVKKISFRLIAATNKDLKILVKEGRFREDLYYRVAKTIINLPSLQERVEDIPVYLDHFLRKISLSFNIKPKKMSEKAIDASLKYNWPGNVRELINILELAMLKAWKSDKIDEEHLPFELISNSVRPINNNSNNSIKNIKKEVADKEKKLIVSALEKTKGNKRQAAIFLHMTRSALYEKIKRYNIA